MTDKKHIKLWRILAYSVLGFIFLIALLAWGGNAALERLKVIEPISAVIFFGVTVIVSGITAIRWGLLTNLIAGKKVCDYFTYYFYFLINRTLGLTLMPQSAADFVLRPLMLRFNHDTTVTQVAGGVIVDRLIDVVLLMMSILPAILYLAGAINTLGFWIILTLLIGLSGLSILWLLRWNIFNRWEKIANQINRVTANPTALYWIIIFSIARFFLISLQFYLAAAIFQVELSWTQIAVALPAAQLIAILAFTPGAIGFREGGFTGAFLLMDIGQEVIQAYVVLQRLLITVTIAILTCIVAIAFFVRKAL